MEINKKILIFDIGANRGLFTDTSLRTFPNLKIITIEPNQNLFNFLVNKYKNNDSVVLMSNVVAEKNDEMIDFYMANADTISTAETDWINNSRFSKEYSWGLPIKIKSVSLDYLIEKYGTPDLIKIDVEGYELEVIKGLSNKQKEICFEWAEEQYEKINKTCEYLKNLGYSNFGFINGDQYLKKPEKYSSWEECEIHNDIDPNRKERWGMIWVH